MTEITDAELDGWEQHWQRRKRVYEEDLDPVLRLIAEVRRLRKENAAIDAVIARYPSSDAARYLSRATAE
jgi:hypothetical protein